MKKTIVVTLALAALAAGVTAQASNRAGVHFGASRSLGSGSAAAWVAVDLDGTPCSMGVQLDEAALKRARDGGEAEIVLPLPQDVVFAGQAPGTGSFRVRYDRERRAWLVMLDGFAPVAGSPAALSAQAAAR